ncbi:MAG: preprotein translocase subunit SecE [Synergistetes bacterium]|nr:preprotein translocase subunit SecE [Synergistota bacterium]MCX8127926.1 preprotein translocase subunit SecE [Synergistota bacterium]MDW8192188.1 preprotein translocase subunit SecE [Synergistota bacterium]
MERFISFLREAWAELKKVTWPSRKQVMYATLTVIVVVMLVSVYLGLVDIFCTWVMGKLLR